MSGYNKILLLGNLVRDPEISKTPNGSSVCRFTVAANRFWKTESGEKREEVYFGDCEAWGKSAETISSKFRKGQPIFVDGRLKTDSWDDKKTGEKRHKTKIVVETWQFCGGQENGERAAAAPKTEKVAEGGTPESDDVPF